MLKHRSPLLLAATAAAGLAATAMPSGNGVRSVGKAKPEPEINTGRERSIRRSVAAHEHAASMRYWSDKDKIPEAIRDHNRLVETKKREKLKRKIDRDRGVK